MMGVREVLGYRGYELGDRRREVIARSCGSDGVPYGLWVGDGGV